MALQSLTDNFNPEHFLLREEQADMITDVFEQYNGKEAIATNLILIGVTGAGKTFTLKKVISNYPDHIYISAAAKKKSNQIISLISKTNVRQTDILLERTINFMKKNNKILIIDELNKIQDPENFFDDMNTIFRETNRPIILITNNPFVIERMNDDARNTLFLKKIVFEKYNTNDLKKICLQRIELLEGDLPAKMDEGTLNYICAVASRIGSARKALNLVRGCYVYDKFDLKHVMSLVEQEEVMDFKTFINSMNEMQRTFLSKMNDIYRDKIAQGQEFITAKDLQSGMPNLNKSKISQLVTEFEDKYGFLETEYVEKGRGGGRYRKITFVDDKTRENLEGAFL